MSQPQQIVYLIDEELCTGKVENETNLHHFRQLPDQVEST